MLDISSFYRYVPKITVTWCMVPEIWNATDRIICHYGPFFALLPPYGPRKSKFKKNEKNNWRYYHFTNVYHKWQSYDIWFFRYGVQQTKIFIILDRFLPFQPPNNPKNQTFEKLKKSPGDIIILHKCTKIHDHMLHCSLDMAHNEFNYFLFWAIFYPFTSLTAQKNQNFEKMKKTPGNIIILHMCTKNYDQMMYGSWDMVCDRCNYFSFLGHFFPFYPPNSLKNQN